MKSIETLDAISKQYDHCSDYRIAKMLGVSRQLVSDIRNGRKTLSSSLRIEAAKLLNQQPAIHLLYLEAERTNDPQVLAVWEHLIARVAAGMGALLIAVMVTMTPQQAEAAQGHNHIDDNLYITRSLLLPGFIVIDAIFIIIGLFFT